MNQRTDNDMRLERAKMLLEIASSFEGPKKDGERLHQACAWKRFDYFSKPEPHPDWFRFEFKSTPYSELFANDESRFAEELTQCRNDYANFLDGIVASTFLKASALPEIQTTAERNLEQARAMNLLIYPNPTGKDGAWKTIMWNWEVFNFPEGSIGLHFSHPSDHPWGDPLKEGERYAMCGPFHIGRYKLVTEDHLLHFTFTSAFAVFADLPPEAGVYRLPYATVLPPEGEPIAPVEPGDKDMEEAFWPNRPLNRLYSKWRKG